MVYFGGFFSQTGIFAGFSLYIISFAEERYEEKNKKRETRRKDQKTMKRDKTKKLGRIVAPYTLILTPNGSKKAWPPRKTPQNDRHIIIQQTVYNIRNEKKNKKTKHSTYEKNKKRLEEMNKKKLKRREKKKRITKRKDPKAIQKRKNCIGTF